jgi:hypothetical protein
MVWKVIFGLVAFYALCCFWVVIEELIKQWWASRKNKRG